ncbi:MAG: Flp pilus assembly protein CpaB [Acidimicrobiia bacterium]
MGRRTLVLIIAVALAAISGFAIYQYLTGVEEDIRSDIAEVGVYRASEQIIAGTPGEDARPLIEGSTALREYVVFEGSSIICTGAVGDNADGNPNEVGCPDNPNDLNAVLDGKVATGPISVGQVITTESFADTRDLQQRLKDAIAPGKVAISIPIDIAGASGGFIRPGDNVNILASASISPQDYLGIISNDELRNLLIEIEVEAGAEEGAPDEGTDGATTTTLPGNLGSAIAGSYELTQTILQNVQVLAVGEDTRPAPLESGLIPVAGVVVFEVTPQEAEQIEWARQYSTIALSLLPAGDYVPYDSQVVVVDDIFGLLDRLEEELSLVSSGTGN